jgi:thiol-disulfide isomerase/thioredoxin
LLLRGFESPITLEKINKYVKDSTLVQLLKARISTNDDLSQLIAAMSNVHIDDYAAVEPEMLLPAILSRHKGKTVFVDLWGTWCAPCIEGHKRMLPLKEKLKDEDVVFIYLAAPNSSIDKWNTMIEDIAGEHYFLTLSQHSYIHNRYFFSKLPAYLLFDGNGKLILNHEGLIENDVLETHIRKVLE